MSKILPAEIVKMNVISYWRFTRHALVVSMEADFHHYDVAVISRDRKLIEVEVKVSLADMRREELKRKHQRAILFTDSLPHYFYFAVPFGLIDEIMPIVQEKYSYAGVLACPDQLDDRKGGWLAPRVASWRRPQLRTRRQLNPNEIFTIAESCSSQLCHAYAKLLTERNGNEVP